MDKDKILKKINTLIDEIKLYIKDNKNKEIDYLYLTNMYNTIYLYYKTIEYKLLNINI